MKSGCDAELKKHCEGVTPGNGRLLACLYAYEDKLSPRCEYALYDASSQLERTVAAVSYVGTECDADLEKYCAQIKPGEGRVAECLKKNRKSLSDRCGKALTDVGFK